jgi:hypothetical protein
MQRVIGERGNGCWAEPQGNEIHCQQGERVGHPSQARWRDVLQNAGTGADRGSIEKIGASEHQERRDGVVMEKGCDRI